jgi:hypothetical protein
MSLYVPIHGPSCHLLFSCEGGGRALGAKARTQTKVIPSSELDAKYKLSSPDERRTCIPGDTRKVYFENVHLDRAKILLILGSSMFFRFCIFFLALKKTHQPKIHKCSDVNLDVRTLLRASP